MQRPASDCAICAMERVEDSSVVFRDELWAAEIMPGAEVPGWIVLRARRHAERITGLYDDESDAFGRRARDLAAALTDVTAAATTYLLAFCENHPHFHALIVARDADVPKDRRSGDILKLLADHTDPAQAIGLVPAIRAAYQHRAAPTPDVLSASQTSN
jgi:diadenosine tetraphosphate (Ap4A) HIT family hydrolase